MAFRFLWRRADAICRDITRTGRSLRWKWHDEPLQSILGIGTCDRAAARAWRLAGPAAAADLKLPVKAPYVQPLFDWTGLYIGAHAGYSRGTSSAVLSDRTRSDGQQHFQRHDRRRAGRLQFSAALRTAARRRSRSSPFRTTSRRIRLSPCWRPRNPTSRAMGLCRHRARPHRLRLRPVARSMPPAGFAWMPASASSTARRRQRRKDPEHPPRLGRRRRPGIRLRAALERAAGISLQPVRTAPTSAFPRARNTPSSMDFQSIRIGLNRKIDWPGSASSDRRRRR